MPVPGKRRLAWGIMATVPVACGGDGGSLNAVFLPDLTPLFALIPGADYGPSVLAPDAAAAYFGVGDGYLKVRVSDGAILEHARCSAPPSSCTSCLTARR